MRNLIVCVFFAACVAVVNAKTCTWTGAADGCWTNRDKNEVDIFTWVHQGDTISEIIDKGGYF